MALPSSGQITLAQIRDEVSPGTTSNVSLRSLSSAAGFSTPDSFSEFYGYSNATWELGNKTASSYISGAGTTSDPYNFRWRYFTGDRNIDWGYNSDDDLFEANLLDTSGQYINNSDGPRLNVTEVGTYTLYFKITQSDFITNVGSNNRCCGALDIRGTTPFYRPYADQMYLNLGPFFGYDQRNIVYSTTATFDQSQFDAGRNYFTLWWTTSTADYVYTLDFRYQVWFEKQ